MTVPDASRLIIMLAILGFPAFAGLRSLAGGAGAGSFGLADEADEYERWRDAPSVYVVPYGIARGVCDRGLLSSELSGGGFGGAAGGIVGSRLARGPEREAALLGGALVGPAAGGVVGHDMDALDRRCVGSALEFAPDRRLVHWRNDQRRVDYEVEPVRTYQSGGGEYCREYQGQAVGQGRHLRISGRACRQSDGSWRVETQ